MLSQKKINKRYLADCPHTNRVIVYKDIIITIFLMSNIMFIMIYLILLMMLKWMQRWS